MELDSIHQSFADLKPEKWVIYEQVPIKYRDLEIAEEEGEKELFIPELRKKVIVKDVLDGYREPKPTNIFEELLKPDKINFQLQQKIEVNQKMGDQININNAQNINVKSTLEHVTQTVTMQPNASASDKAELQKLLTQLVDLLAKVPPNKMAEAEYTTEQTKKLIEQANQNKPLSILKITSSGLIEAVKTLAEMADPVLAIVNKIVKLVVGE